MNESIEKIISRYPGAAALAFMAHWLIGQTNFRRPAIREFGYHKDYAIRHPFCLNEEIAKPEGAEHLQKLALRACGLGTNESILEKMGETPVETHGFLTAEGPAGDESTVFVLSIESIRAIRLLSDGGLAMPTFEGDFPEGWAYAMADARNLVIDASQANGQPIDRAAFEQPLRDLLAQAGA